MSDQPKPRKEDAASPTGAPDCIFCGRPPHPDSYGHSYRPRPPNPTTGEWTAATVKELRHSAPFNQDKTIADAHNAALAAEKSREEFDWGHVKREYLRLQKENYKLEEQLATVKQDGDNWRKAMSQELATERRNYSKVTHKWEQCVIENQQLQEQLASEPTTGDLIERLRYIAVSPSSEYGGFHEQAIQIANDAIAAIAKIGAK